MRDAIHDTDPCHVLVGAFREHGKGTISELGARGRGLAFVQRGTEGDCDQAGASEQSGEEHIAKHGEALESEWVVSMLRCSDVGWGC